MLFKKPKKFWTSTILSIIAVSTISSSVYLSTTTEQTKTTLNSQENNASVSSRSSKESQSITYKLGDIIDSYQSGYNIYTVNDIVVASPLATSQTTPDLSKTLFRISINNGVINITNTYSSNQLLWDQKIDYNNNMFTAPTSFDKPDTNALSKNYFKFTEYNNTTNLNGANTIIWDSNNNVPSSIAGARTVNDKNAFLLQMSIENISSVSSGERAQIFINKGTIDQPIWDLPNATYGWTSLGTQFAMEGFFVKDIESNSVKYYAPNTTTPSIGSWKINTNSTTESYLNLPIQMAFEQLMSKPQDISDIVDWRPTLLLPSMADFPITLSINTSKNWLQFEYGNNDSFKYIFNAIQKGTSRHIFPFFFDTTDISPSEMPGTYINIKNNFENYELKRSIIDGFTKGTYIIPLTWTIDKNRYPSQVLETEIKKQALSHIGNAPEGLTEDDIVISRSNNFITDNSTGQISFNIILKKYINDNGEIVTDQLGKTFEPRQTIAGFKSIAPTKFNTSFEVYDINDSNLIATDQTPDDVKNVIIKNKKIFFNTLASDIGGEELTANDLNVNITFASNNTTSEYTSGHLIADVSVTANFLTEPYALIAKRTDSPLNFRIIIKGYKVLKSTTIHTSVNIVQSNKYATDQDTNDIRNLIVQYPDLFVQNYPSDIDLSDPNDFKINSFITKDNLGSPDVFDGQYGYVKLNVTIAKVYNDKGQIEFNKTYDLTISGYVKVTPTNINTSVTIPNMTSSLVSDIINNEGDIHTLITRNQSLFFGSTSLTTDYATYLTVVSYEYSNINDVYQLVANISLTKYFNSNGILVNPESNNPLVATIYISGFKVITPTRINGGAHTISARYQSFYASFITRDVLNEIILATQGGIENGSIITGSRPTGFSQNNLIVSNVNANNLAGTIEFELNLNLRYEDNEQGNLTTDPFPSNTRIILRGFKIAEPTRPSLTNPLVVTNNYQLLKQSNPVTIRQIILKDINSEVLTDTEKQTLEQLKLFLWTEAFVGYKDPFNVEHIKIIEINKYDNLAGSIQLTFSITRYMDNNGEVVDGEITTIRDIVGFKIITPTSINKQEYPFIVPSNLYGAVTPQYIIENNLLPEVIKNHDAQYIDSPHLKIILGDLPPDFSYEKNLIITNIVVDDIYATISFMLSLNYYYNNVNGELVTPDTGFALPPVKVTLRGFKTIPSTTINGNILTDEYFYPTPKTSKGKTLMVDIQNKSNLKYTTSAAFVESINKTSSNPSDVVNEYLKSIFYYSDDLYETITANQPLVVYNPQSNRTIHFDAIVVNSIDNAFGSISITARARGFYYNHSNEATQIVNTNGSNYAYIDIQLNGFLLEVYEQFNVQNIFIIFAVTIPGSIIAIFFMFLLLRSVKKRKFKKGDDDVEDLLIRD